MKRYTVRMVADGGRKFYYIQDKETFGIAPLPSRFLKYKIDTNRSPNTVKRTAFSLCCYMEYLAEEGREISEVWNLDFEEQSRHFVGFLYWLKEGGHTMDNRIGNTGNGTCNAYLKDVFRFFLYLVDCECAKPLKVLSYNQITVGVSI